VRQRPHDLRGDRAAEVGVQLGEAFLALHPRRVSAASVMLMA
jgi:hypothetical protein